MYFVIIMAFALVLSDNLPPDALNLFSRAAFSSGVATGGTLAIVGGQLLIMWAYAVVMRRRTLRRMDGTDAGHDDAAETYGSFQFAMLFVLSAFLILSMVSTPWTRIVRESWGLERIPLVSEIILLAPLFLSLLIVWLVNYPVELRLRSEALSAPHHGPDSLDARLASDSIGSDHGSARTSPGGFDANTLTESAAQAALRASSRQDTIEQLHIGAYLADKFRHQVLLLAAPMCIIVVAKYLINEFGPRILPLPRDPLIRDILLNSALGTVSVVVLTIAPWLLRHIWSTEPLPSGPLRDRFTRICRRIGLRYREILLWHTHGATVNAAVMGFISPLRYVLVSDALLETMEDDEIEAVFGHEAGHVRHWHLPFFGVFALVSMYVAGGVMHLLFLLDHVLGDRVHIDNSLLQLSALGTLLLMWLFGFAWLSRKFERQADLFGVRCITPDIHRCTPGCPIHGNRPRAGLCITAANIFGRTLTRIAELNGIPREAPSWRHGSIESRCQLIEAFAGDDRLMRKFDRRLLTIKIGLVAALVLGTMVAGLLYYEPVMRALRAPQPRSPGPGAMKVVQAGDL